MCRIPIQDNISTGMESVSDRFAMTYESHTETHVCKS